MECSYALHRADQAVLGRQQGPSDCVHHKPDVRNCRKWAIWEVHGAGRAQLVILRLAANSGPAVARNVGLAWVAERGIGMVCFLDADCRPDPGWLAAMEAGQAATPGILCGRTVAMHPHTAVGVRLGLSEADCIPLRGVGVCINSSMSHRAVSGWLAAMYAEQTAALWWAHCHHATQNCPGACLAMVGLAWSLPALHACQLTRPCKAVAEQRTLFRPCRVCQPALPIIYIGAWIGESSFP